MGLTVVTQPTEEPLALADIKQYLRIDVPDDDALLQGLIVAARQHAEWYTRRAFITQTLRVDFDSFPPSPKPLELPRAPLQSVDSVTYIDTNGTQQTLTAGVDYIVETSVDPGRISLPPDKQWPVTAKQAGAVVVEYVAGYGDASAVPQALKQAMTLLIAHWYENRVPVVQGVLAEIPFAVTALLDMHRVWGYA